MEQRNTNRTLLRGLEILRAFNDLKEPTVTNIARATGLPKSTTSRFLSVLIDEGYLRVDANMKFTLAPKVLELGFSALRSLGITEVVASPLQDIADMCMGASNVGELDGTDVIMIARRTARTQRERFYSLNINIGTRLPALYTATGRVLLSCSPKALDEAIKVREKSRTSSTSIVDDETLRQRVEAGARSGCIRIRDELAPGFGAVAIAIKVSETRTVALSGSYLLSDHGPDIEDRVEAELRSKSALIAGLLSASGDLPAAR
ncbi:MAG: helix-turn-helix domain-containing protein [Polaromonas sp.]|nr:helix-turn-helix domain-containing protein [Polaromonas sp.]